VTDIVDHRRRSEMMARIGPRNTTPEIAVRRAAHALGFRFRLHRKDLPGCPDAVFPKRRLAVFVHGCFWHRHEGCSNCTMPKTRPEFWRQKFEGNVERDRRNCEQLTRLGWRILIVWECESEDRARLEQTLIIALGSRPANPQHTRMASA
jgi:DNA mismatch endonuclease, patch repair protein